jgi:F0F1-type ATP synthase membrane subunit c/vacuolar-type H+-ATPase subunit K
MAERPEMFASSVIMMAIPETVIILGFVIAVMIMLVLPGA